MINTKITFPTIRPKQWYKRFWYYFFPIKFMKIDDIMKANPMTLTEHQKELQKGLIFYMDYKFTKKEDKEKE